MRGEQGKRVYSISGWYIKEQLQQKTVLQRTNREREKTHERK